MEHNTEQPQTPLVHGSILGPNKSQGNWECIFMDLSLLRVTEQQYFTVPSLEWAQHILLFNTNSSIAF